MPRFMLMMVKNGTWALVCGVADDDDDDSMAMMTIPMLILMHVSRTTWAPLGPLSTTR